MVERVSVRRVDSWYNHVSSGLAAGGGSEADRGGRTMCNRLARIALVLFWGWFFPGCNGGVAVNLNLDAGPMPDLGPDLDRDVGIVVVNLPDTPAASETAGMSCLTAASIVSARTVAMASSRATSSATTATPLRATAARATARSSRAGRARQPGVSCQPMCGDGLRAGRRRATTATPTSGDGCSADCAGRAGLDVPGGRRALPRPTAATAVRAGDEECDDGNTAIGDGCSLALPARDRTSICPTPGPPCISTVVCGDGTCRGNEACDDDNTNDGDGCSADCSQVEPGWVCPAPGVRCLAQVRRRPPDRLGGVRRRQHNGGRRLQRRRARSSPATPAPRRTRRATRPCAATAAKEGSESCDDGNTIPGDGCAPDCRSEPICTGTNGCTSPCGDGLKLPDEECDDGNQTLGRRLLVGLQARTGLGLQAGRSTATTPTWWCRSSIAT